MFDERIWREFPKTVQEFDLAFADEAACRRFLVLLRWGGSPICGRCGGDEMWALANGRFECSECGYQMSVTVGTPLQGTRKPLKLWFRAMWEIAARKTGISAKDLQRILGFGSYETAWCWLHKLRRCLVRGDRSPLGGDVMIDDAYLGSRSPHTGRPGTAKAAVFVAEERGGRIRIEHTPDLSTRSVSSFLARNTSEGSLVTTDGYGTHNRYTIPPRRHRQIIAKHLPKRAPDPFQRAHQLISLMKRWWMGTYHGGISRKHLQLYLDELQFRYNRRKTQGVGRIMARMLQILAQSKPITCDAITGSSPCPRFATT